jgi:hypothetical protein
VTTADSQSEGTSAQAKSRFTLFDICDEEDYKAMKRGWVTTKYVGDHPVPKQTVSDTVKHEYTLEVARHQFVFIVAYSLSSQTELDLPNPTAQKGSLVTFMY